MKLYHYRQTNSFGVFEINEDVNKDVYVQANNANHANSIAEEIGIYFNGCESGIDCYCCGNRWNEADEYGNMVETRQELVEELKSNLKYLYDEQFGVFAIIYTLDGFRHTVSVDGVQSVNRLITGDVLSLETSYLQKQLTDDLFS